MSEDCFNRRCSFHLKNGDTVIGGVLSNDNNKFVVEQKDGIKREFSQNLVYSYEVYGNKGWDIEQTRGGLVGKHSAKTSGSARTKKMIILGAGASSDFGTINNGINIPLTNDLFNDGILINNFPGAVNLKPKILTAVDNGESLEDFFQEKWDEVTQKGDLDLLYKLINTQYFIQLYFWSISQQLQNHYPNNFTRLLRHVQNYLKDKDEKENIGVISFNYDTLFENALKNIFDYEYKTPEDYVYLKEYNFSNLKPVMFFKPHGSWNWVHTFEKRLADNAAQFGNVPSMAKFVYESQLTFADLIFSIAPKLERSDNILSEIPSLYMDNFKIIQYNEEMNYGFYPNLLIPFSDKDNILMPKFHESLMRLKMEEVEEILIIGWKGTEKYFNSLLKMKMGNRKIKVTYISRHTKTTEEELKKYLPLAEFHHFQGTFTSYLNKLKEKNSEEFSFFK